MNYIKQSVSFFELQLTKQISANAQALYHTLFNINNKCDWKEGFTVANMMLSAYTGLSVQSVIRARDELIDAGVIIYKKGKANQCGEYEIVKLYREDAEEMRNDSDNKSGTLYKQNKTKQDKIKQNIKKGPLNNFYQEPPDFKEIEEIVLEKQSHF